MNKKAVIIGNGKSINDHIERGDFDLLQHADNVETFAMNQIHRIYDRVSWRPDNWFMMESENWKRAWKDAVKYHFCEESNEQPYIAITHREVVQYYFDTAVAPKYLCRCQHFITNNEVWHLPVVCRYGGTISIALQTAYQLGFREVAVIGCDLGIKAGGGDHFDEDYVTVLEPRETFEMKNEILINAHTNARQYLNIFNCGIGGELEVHPRMELEEFINV